MRKIKGCGPEKADIVIVGEAPGENEEILGEPFVGASGYELNRWLMEVGILKQDCYITYVCKYKPEDEKIKNWITDKKKIGEKNGWKFQDGKWFSEEIAAGLLELTDEILAREPKIVIGLGALPLWALTGQWDIADWRGSEMFVRGTNIPFVGTYHPATIFINFALGVEVRQDITYRIKRRLDEGFELPNFEFKINPTLDNLRCLLKCFKQGDLSVDIETSRGKIVCVGIAHSDREAICIPFMHEDSRGNRASYWNVEEEKEVLEILKTLLLNPNINIIGQNFAYDASYFKDNFGFTPQVNFDTYIAQSVLYPGAKRTLGYLSSMYCDWHCYCKDDASDWNNLKDFKGLFTYNCRDTCATFEIAQIQKKELRKEGLMNQFLDRMKYGKHVFNMMWRGVIRDPTRTKKMIGEIKEALDER
ncbi:MAG: uracil-DNA glycosylase family protein, partial [Nanoarchaeota archaeon]